MPALFGYVGPEVMMPLASVAAAIGGAIMLFGRRMLYMFKKGVRAIASVVRRD